MPHLSERAVTHAGHVIAGDGMIKSAHRCEPCGTVFWFVRKRIPSRP
jgi:hypothetical protein